MQPREDEAAYVAEVTCIWLYRDEPLPSPDSEPDTWSPDKDACFLAHEYAHFLTVAFLAAMSLSSSHREVP